MQNGDSKMSQRQYIWRWFRWPSKDKWSNDNAQSWGNIFKPIQIYQETKLLWLHTNPVQHRVSTFTAFFLYCLCNNSFLIIMYTCAQIPLVPNYIVSWSGCRERLWFIAHPKRKTTEHHGHDGKVMYIFPYLIHPFHSQWLNSIFLFAGPGFNFVQNTRVYNMKH